MCKCVTAAYSEPFRGHYFKHRDDSLMILYIDYAYIPMHVRLVL